MDLPVVEARRFLRSLPTASGTRTAPMFAAPAGRGARLTSRGGSGTVPLSGPERLRVLDPLLRFATSLRAYAAGDAGAGASVWELTRRDARRCRWPRACCATAIRRGWPSSPRR